MMESGEEALVIKKRRQEAIAESFPPLMFHER
jgi:hypothetical protein